LSLFLQFSDWILEQFWRCGIFFFFFHFINVLSTCKRSSRTNGQSSRCYLEIMLHTITIHMSYPEIQKYSSYDLQLQVCCMSCYIALWSSLLITLYPTNIKRHKLLGFSIFYEYSFRTYSMQIGAGMAKKFCVLWKHALCYVL